MIYVAFAQVFAALTLMCIAFGAAMFLSRFCPDIWERVDRFLFGEEPE